MGDRGTVTVSGRLIAWGLAAVAAVFVGWPTLANAQQSGHDSGAATVMVAPTGDVSGVADADNIEAALRAVEERGGTVLLSDGDPSTVDHFFASRGIVIEGAAGRVEIRGEGRDQTILEARRGASGAEFQWAFESTVLPFLPGRLTNYPSLLWFERGSGIGLDGLTLQASGLTLVDEAYIFGYQPGAGALTFLVMEAGGTGDTVVRDVRFGGGAGSFTYFCVACPGSNVIAGIRSMKGPDRETPGRGDFVATGNEAEGVSFPFWPSSRKNSRIVLSGNVAWNTSAPYVVGSSDGETVATPVVISDNEAHNSLLRDVWMVGGMRRSSVRIQANRLDGGFRHSGDAILLRDTPDATVRDNTVIGSGFTAIALVLGSDRAVIEDNVFHFAPFGSVIFVYFSDDSVFRDNDYTGSTIPGWSGQPGAGVCEGGPGAIELIGGGHSILDERLPGEKVLAYQVCDRGEGNVIGGGG